MASIEEIVVQPPQTATWLVHIDRSMWVGGVRGLMLQALHPLAMRGVCRTPTSRVTRSGGCAVRLTSWAG